MGEGQMRELTRNHSGGPTDFAQSLAIGTQRYGSFRCAPCFTVSPFTTSASWSHV